MANAVFTPAREGILDDTISLSVGVIKAVLVRAYTYSAAHKFVSDVTTAGGVLHGTPQTLGTKTFTGGVFDAADVTFTAVAANASNHVVLIYQASAVGGGADVAATAQRVIGYYDTGTLLPVVPNGGDITVAWDNGANKIFAIA
jgi:hypothetical protein